MTLGTEWLIDASGCDAEALANLDRLRAVFDRIIRDLDLHVLGTHPDADEPRGNPLKPGPLAHPSQRERKREIGRAHV